MEGSIADELYSEALQLSKTELNPPSTDNYSDAHALWDGDGSMWDGDGSMWDGSVEELNRPSDLNWEWQKRRNQFHNIGYRDGLTAGKEASAQEGFNLGFEQSVLVGYKWGLVRGVTSALTCLPDGLKEKLVETPSKREKFHCLYEFVHALSTTDGLKLFRDDIMIQKSENETQNSEANSSIAGFQDQNSVGNFPGKYFEELQSLLSESLQLK